MQRPTSTGNCRFREEILKVERYSVHITSKVACKDYGACSSIISFQCTIAERSPTLKAKRAAPGMWASSFLERNEKNVDMGAKE